MHKNIIGSGSHEPTAFSSGTTTLIISNEETEDIMTEDITTEDIITEDITSLEKSGLLIKGFGEIIENDAKEQKGGFIGMLLGTLGASLLRNLLAGKDLRPEINKKLGRWQEQKVGDKEQLQQDRNFNAASSFG